MMFFDIICSIQTPILAKRQRKRKYIKEKEIEKVCSKLLANVTSYLQVNKHLFL